MDRPHIRVIPEWFGGGTLPRKGAESTGYGLIDADYQTALLAAATAPLAFAAFQLREKHQEAEAAVQSIHDQLDALDPVHGPRSLPD